MRMKQPYIYYSQYRPTTIKKKSIRQAVICKPWYSFINWNGKNVLLINPFLYTVI